MTNAQTNKIIQFITANKHAVVASINAVGKPQAALVGIAITEKGEIIFDTLQTTRKYANLIANSSIAVVINDDHEITVQYEGIASVLKEGEELARYKEYYFRTFPDGHKREKWPGITYFLVTPVWARYSDFNSPEPEIFEVNF